MSKSTAKPLAAEQLGDIPAKGRVLLMFTGERCAPCEALKPLLIAEAMRRPGTTLRILTPTPEAMNLYRHYGARTAPTVLYLVNGLELGRFTGMRSPEALAETLNRWNVM